MQKRRMKHLPFTNALFHGLGSKNTAIYAHSIDIRKCKDTSCCGLPRAKEVIEFLESYNSFLLPVTKAKDGHFTNPIHLL